MKESSSETGYNLQEISGQSSLQQLCQKQKKLIEMLQKQVDTLKKVIVDMESDIKKYEGTVKSLAKEYNVKYQAVADLQHFLPHISSKISKIINEKTTNKEPIIQFKQVIKEVPIFIQKQIQVIREVEKPIFVEKIREVEKPVFVQKIIQIPCASCQLAAHKRIKT